MKQSSFSETKSRLSHQEISQLLWAMEDTLGFSHNTVIWFILSQISSHLSLCYLSGYFPSDLLNNLILSSLDHHPDDGGRTHLWNNGPIQWDYTALHPRRL